ncbi:hypothetical protein ABTL20_21780, partial [Acinetobacter baumannii]
MTTSTDRRRFVATTAGAAAALISGIPASASASTTQPLSTHQGSPMTPANDHRSFKIDNTALVLV